MRRVALLLGMLLIIGSNPCDAVGEELSWPQWRGAKGRGVSEARGLPVTWTAESGIAWRLPLPDRSAATPARWGQQLFLSTPNGEDVELWCVTADGKPAWKRKVGTGNRALGWNSKNNFATPSPVTDGKSVWVLAGSGDVACFDFEGNERWHRSLTADHGPITCDFGLGTSPLLFRDRLFVACIHRRAESYLLAIDSATGRDVWKTARPTSAIEESRDAYSTPAVYEHPDGRAEIVLCAADMATGYDFQDGREIWRHGDINLNNNPTLRIVVSPVTTPDLIYVTSAKRGPMYAIRPGGQGDITSSHRAWTQTENTPDVATPAVYNGLLFMIQEKGVLSCLDAQTGKPHWTERLDAGYFPCSPLVADGKVYVGNEQGQVFVVAAEPKYKLLATNSLDDQILASPVPAEERLYFRTEGALVCVGK